MPVFRRVSACVLTAWLMGTGLALAQAAAPPVTYRLTYPNPEQRWLQVEARFAALPAAPLQLRMSRTSPGRYALHEFAKNVFEVRITDGAGKALAPTRPNLHQWDVAGHDGTVVLTYKVFGDRTDGTYLSVDPAHAHMNMPATLMWARGLGERPARVTIVPPAGRNWKVATQLFPTDDPFTFTAPNLAYVMDSPTEVSDFMLRTFVVEDGKGGKGTYRIALHHDGTEAEADAYARDVEKIVREAVGLFGELPKFDGGTYTFLADYLPWANGDGMEHRNSTVLSSSGALRNPTQRTGLLGTVAHEYVHSWNMERIRDKAIEPFDFEEADVSGELWFGEGFTNYLEDLISQRSGMVKLDDTLGNWAGVIDTIALTPGRRLRSAEDMSMLAPFVDAAVSIDRTAWPNLFISYYTFGEGLGLALDLALRGRSDNQVSIDDYMRAVWAEFGKPGQGGAPGMVTRPYTVDGLRATLGKVAGDQAFADDFFAKYVQGHEVADYKGLLDRAGLIVRPRTPNRPWLGNARLQSRPDGRLQLASIVPFDSPLARAGAAQDDVLLSLNGRDLSSTQVLDEVLAGLRPGGTATLQFARRTGERVSAQLPLEADPRIEIVPAEDAGSAVTPAQKQFRDRWLAPRAH